MCVYMYVYIIFDELKRQAETENEVQRNLCRLRFVPEVYLFRHKKPQK